MSAQILQFKKRTTKADWERWLEGMHPIVKQVARQNIEAAKSAEKYACKLVICEAGSVTMRAHEQIIIWAMGMGFFLWSLISLPVSELLALIGN